jgi:hypothetical protein
MTVQVGDPDLTRVDGVNPYNTMTIRAIAGEVISVGMAVSVDPAAVSHPHPSVLKADCTATDKSLPLGVAVLGSNVPHSGDGKTITAGETFDVVIYGPIPGFDALTVGVDYFVAAVAGSIAEIGDLVSTNRVSPLGLAVTPEILLVRPASKQEEIVP